MREDLKFHFTPVDRPGDDEPNPLAKTSTNIPEVVDDLVERFGDDVSPLPIYAGERTVLVSKARLLDVCRYLKEECNFDYLSDLGGIDRFTEDDRFEVMYNLVSLAGRKRLRLKVRVDEDEPEVDSVTCVWAAANWNERECWDMIGIRFKGHPDMRRMFMPEDFEYHPLRKEFPPLGIPGSLPIPSFESDGKVQSDPFAAAVRNRPEE